MGIRLRNLKSKTNILFPIALLLIVIHAVISVQSETSNPNIEFLETTTFDFGKVVQGKTISHTFKFKNTGDADLEIYLVRSTCRCIASLMSGKIIKPGATGELKFTFDSAPYSGKLTRTAYIHSNDPTQPRIKLTLTGYVEKKVNGTSPTALKDYRHLTILYSGDEQGQIEPPSGAEGQNGGLARQATLIESERQNASGGFLLLGVGDTFGENDSHDKRRAELTLSAMNEMRYDALVLGEREFAFGKAFIQQQLEKKTGKREKIENEKTGKRENGKLKLEVGSRIKLKEKEAEFPIIAANIIDESTGELFASAPYILKDIGGVKVGIIGVIDGSYLTDERWGELGLRVSDSIAAVRKALEEIRPKSDLVIVLGHLGIAKAAVIAQTVHGIDLLIAGHGTQKLTKPLKAGRTYIVMNNDKGRTIGKLEIWLDEEKKITGIEGSEIP